MRLRIYLKRWRILSSGSHIIESTRRIFETLAATWEPMEHLRNIHGYQSTRLIQIFTGRLIEYQVIGRHLPTETNPTPKLYRMRIFAPNTVVAKSRFWYFLMKLRKVKKANGEIISLNEVGCYCQAFHQWSKGGFVLFKKKLLTDSLWLDPREATTEGQELRHLDSLRLKVRHTQHVQGVPGNVEDGCGGGSLPRYGSKTSISFQVNPCTFIDLQIAELRPTYTVDL